MDEIWKDAIGLEGIYQVSDLGRIKRIAKARGARPGYILSPSRGGTDGKYLKVVLGKLWGKEYVHRMVALAFHGPPPSDAHEVNHLNGDTYDNRASNLQWATRSENNLHSYRHLGRKATVPFGEGQWNSKLKAEDVRKIRRKWATGRFSQRELGEMFDVRQSTISGIVLGKAWKHI